METFIVREANIRAYVPTPAIIRPVDARSQQAILFDNRESQPVTFDNDYPRTLLDSVNHICDEHGR